MNGTCQFWAAEVQGVASALGDVSVPFEQHIGKSITCSLTTPLDEWVYIAGHERISSPLELEGPMTPTMAMMNSRALTPRSRPLHFSRHQHMKDATE